MEDLVLENSRNGISPSKNCAMRNYFLVFSRDLVTIRIPHICAAHVKMQLWFAAQWIMISEVTFDSRKWTLFSYM